MSDTNATRRVEFKLHQNLLAHLVDHQAATPQKALLELVMNAADAGATRVDIGLTKDGFTLSDDGSGFRSEQDILDFFATFGAPQEREKTYGRFRVGRAQIFGWARTIWESNGYRMIVDLETDQHGFDLQPLDSTMPGCHISGRWIRGQVDAEHLEHELVQALLYPPLQVWINGRQVSKPVTEQEWTSQTDDAYFRLTTHGRLRLYNQGVFVCDFEHHAYHVGGVVITKAPIELTMARNEPLPYDPGWQRIHQHLREQAQALHEQGGSVGTEEFRAYALRSALDGLGDPDATCLTVIPKRHTSLSEFISMLQQTRTVIYASRGELARVERAIQTGRLRAATLHFETIERLRNVFDGLPESTDEEVVCLLLDRLEQRVGLAAMGGGEIGIYGSDSLPEDEAVAELVNEADLTGFERFLLDACNDVLLSLVFELGLEWRSLKVCAPSKVMHAFTDGVSFVAFSRTLLGNLMAMREGAALELVLTFIHEMCHEEDSRNAGHDDVFYNRYHELTIENAAHVTKAVRALQAAQYHRPTAFQVGPTWADHQIWWDPAETRLPTALDQAMEVAHWMNHAIRQVALGKISLEEARENANVAYGGTRALALTGHPWLRTSDPAPHMRLIGPVAQLRALAPFTRAPSPRLLEAFLEPLWSPLGLSLPGDGSQTAAASTLKVIWHGHRVGTIKLLRKELRWIPSGAAGQAFAEAFSQFAALEPDAFPWEQRSFEQDLYWALLAITTLQVWKQGQPPPDQAGALRLWVRRKSDPEATRWVLNYFGLDPEGADMGEGLGPAAWRAHVEEALPHLMVIDGSQSLEEGLRAFDADATLAETPQQQALFWLKWSGFNG